MAINTSTVWEVRNTGGDDANGGGFGPAIANGVTDYAATSGTTSAPVVTSATYTFVAGDVDSYIFILSGTNWTPGWYKITSVAGGAATVDASVGAAVLYEGAVPLRLNTVAGIATVGSPTGGTGSVDYSQQDAAEASGTATSAGTTLTATTGIFTPVMVGNCIANSSAARQITAYTSSLVVTLDADPSWAAQTVKVGGALATIGKAGGVRAQDNGIFTKYNATPETLSSASSNVAGGTLTISAGTDSITGFVVGYDTTRTLYNTDANRPTIKIPGAGVSSVTMINCSATYSGLRVRNVICDGSSKTAIVGFAGATRGANFHNCKALSCTTGFSTARALLCLADTCAIGFESGSEVACVSVGHTSQGFHKQASTTGLAVFCIAANGTGASADGFAFDANDNEGGFLNCLAYGNERHGFLYASFVRAFPNINCLASDNGGYGFTTTTNTAPSWFINNAGWSNTSGNTSFQFAAQSTGFIDCTADPINNAAGDDYSLNNVAGGGALLRAAGFPGAFPGTSTTGYLDIGAVQHQDAGGAAVEYVPGRRMVGWTYAR